MFENMTWLDALLVACIVFCALFSLWFVDTMKAYRRHRDAEKLIVSARSKLENGGNPKRVLSGLAYMAKEAGLEKEVNDLWPELYEQEPTQGHANGNGA